MAAFNATVAAPSKKSKILGATEFSAVCKFIRDFHGLPFDCEIDLINKHFTHIEPLTLRSILEAEVGSHMRSQYRRLEGLGKKHLKTFEDQSKHNNESTLLIKIAICEGINPVALCRAVLQAKYQFKNKTQLTRLLNYPFLIEDSKLAENVAQCLTSDNQEGPLVDLHRRLLGEEFEFKLKEMAKAAGMHFYEENDLRKMGFDKTPDIKMILPFAYKGEVVNWIESKAIFGDVTTHKWYIQQQLNSYSNRFGPGIVIYWFGYHEATQRLEENNVGIIVLADFPDEKDLEFFDLNGKSRHQEKSKGIACKTEVSLSEIE